MTDLHCHILPGIDDGARDVETAIALLSMEKEQGVDKIVFTPHFRCDDIGLDEFLEARDSAFNLLMDSLPSDLKSSFDFKLGAEVYFSPTLSRVDFSKLCFTDTSYMLVELPFTSGVRPAFLDEILFDISFLYHNIKISLFSKVHCQKCGTCPKKWCKRIPFNKKL